MPDPDLLAAVLTRILSQPTATTNQWALTWDELTITATIPITPEERDAIGQATGNPTIADPYIRGYVGPLPLPPPPHA